MPLLPGNRFHQGQKLFGVYRVEHHSVGSGQQGISGRALQVVAGDQDDYPHRPNEIGIYLVGVLDFVLDDLKELFDPAADLLINRRAIWKINSGTGPT